MEKNIRDIFDKQYIPLAKQALNLNDAYNKLLAKRVEIEEKALPLIPLENIVDLLVNSPISPSEPPDLNEDLNAAQQKFKKIKLELQKIAGQMKETLDKMALSQTQIKDSFLKLKTEIEGTKAETEEGKEDLRKIAADCATLLDFVEKINLNTLIEYCQQYLPNN
jgi:methyl-accepting chemotaxis protein